MLEQADVLDYDADSNTTEITRNYYQANGLGSVMAITDANQSDVAEYRYSPYGEVTITRSGSTVSADPLGQAWTFTGWKQRSERSSFSALCWSSLRGGRLLPLAS